MPQAPLALSHPCLCVVLLEALCFKYCIPFPHFPPMTREPIRFLSHGPESLKALALEEVNYMLLKDAMETMFIKIIVTYNRLFLVEKPSYGWRPMNDLSPMNECVGLTKFKIVYSVLSSIRKGDLMFSTNIRIHTSRPKVIQNLR